MDSFIKKYDEENQTSGFFVEKFLQHILYAADTLSDTIRQELVDLLLLPYSPDPSVLLLLAQPWIRANMLANFLEAMDLGTEKQRVKRITRQIDALIKELELWPEESLLFLLFQTSSELQVDRVLASLKEVKAFLTQYSQLNFNRGQIHTPDFLRRYAIDSLLWMGKTIELKETDNHPTQLNKYIHVVTGRLYEDIDKDHHYYNKGEDYLLKYKQDESFFLMFIFNPKCAVTDDILYTLSHFKNTRKTLLDKL